MVDDKLIKQVAAVLGTEGLKETIDGALREVLRRDAVGHFWEVMDECVDWDVLAHVDELLWDEQPSLAT
jgi:Arc/MetJ family transcription regulator